MSVIESLGRGDEITGTAVMAVREGRGKNLERVFVHCVGAFKRSQGAEKRDKKGAQEVVDSFDRVDRSQLFLRPTPK